MRQGSAASFAHAAIAWVERTDGLHDCILGWNPVSRAGIRVKKQYGAGCGKDSASLFACTLSSISGLRVNLRIHAGNRWYAVTLPPLNLKWRPTANRMKNKTGIPNNVPENRETYSSQNEMRLIFSKKYATTQQEIEQVETRPKQYLVR